MKPAVNALVVLVLIAALSVAMSPSPGPELPVSLKKGSQLHGLQLVRPTASVLSGYGGTGPIDVVEVKDGWIAVTYQGAQGKTNWINIGQIVAFRTER